MKEFSFLSEVSVCIFYCLWFFYSLWSHDHHDITTYVNCYHWR